MEPDFYVEREEKLGYTEQKEGLLKVKILYMHVKQVKGKPFLGNDNGKIFELHISLQ